MRFPRVQHQRQTLDCGVFSIAFAISIIHGQNPEEITYDHPRMRKHLLNMFENGEIKMFPCVVRTQVDDFRNKMAFRQHEMICGSTHQEHSQQTGATNWATIVRQTKTVVHPQVRDENYARRSCSKPLLTNLRKKSVSTSISQQSTTIHNHDHISDRAQLSQDTREIQRVNNIVIAKQLSSQGDSQHNLAPRMHVGDGTRNLWTVVTTKKSTKRKRIRAPLVLDNECRDKMTSGAWLNDLHMNQFVYLMRTRTTYSPRETYRVQMLATIIPILPTQKHIQLLFADDNHWVCTYYDTKSIFVYDSLNKKRLHADHQKFLKALLPFYPFDKKKD